MCVFGISQKFEIQMSVNQDIFFNLENEQLIGNLILKILSFIYKTKKFYLFLFTKIFNICYVFSKNFVNILNLNI